LQRAAAPVLTVTDRDPHVVVTSTSLTPDARNGLNRWLPLVKWFLAIPHYVVLFFLSIAAAVLVIASCFAILLTGRFRRGIFDFLVGVGRSYDRVVAYAILLVTDECPPFRLGP